MRDFIYGRDRRFMQSILVYLENVLATYWGQSKYQLFLYIAIIVILLLEKEAWKKITFGWYGIVCFIGLLNPITVKITSKVWGESVAYYCRQVSLIPIFVIIAYGILRLLSIVEKKNKLILTAFVTVLIVVSGHQIYQESWYTKADDCSKIPAQIIELSKFFKEKDGVVRVAATTNISVYLRQYENVIQVQGRYPSDGVIEEQLQSERPDVLNIMQYAGELECDYIIVEGGELVQNIYKLAGYEPCFKTDMYLVYNVEGINRWKRVCDEKNRVYAKVCLDEKNHIKCDGNKEYAIIRYIYDDKNNACKENYYDEKRKPMALSLGQYGVIYKYNKNGKKSEVIYLDEKGDVMQTNSGYAVIGYTYDKHGDKITECYYDENKKPIALELGQYGVLYTFYNGRVSERSYLDKYGNICNTTKGYAKVVYLYDENGNVIANKYYNLLGKEVKWE